jgi:hypothetical protein
MSRLLQALLQVFVVLDMPETPELSWVDVAFNRRPCTLQIAGFAECNDIKKREIPSLLLLSRRHRMG